jgi:hypothetical protein
MTLLRLNFQGNVFVPLITELLILAKKPLELGAGDRSTNRSLPQICQRVVMDTYLSLFHRICAAPLPRREKTNLGVGAGSMALALQL